MYQDICISCKYEETPVTKAPCCYCSRRSIIRDYFIIKEPVELPDETAAEIGRGNFVID